MLDRATAGTLNLGRDRPAYRVAAHDAAAEWLVQAMPVVSVPEDGWTARVAGDQLISALRWARYAAGRTGPAGMVSARLPEAILSDEEFLEMSWGIRETADPEDIPPMRIQPTPAQISRHEAVLQWPAIYLVGEGREGSAKMVGLWAACKAYRRPFPGAVKVQGVPRGMAYQLRDRGLSITSQGLQRDGIPLSP